MREATDIFLKTNIHWLSICVCVCVCVCVYKIKDEMSFAATWMDLEIIMLSEISQTEKDNYHVISFICGILKKIIQRNLFIEYKSTCRHRKQTYGY